MSLQLQIRTLQSGETIIDALDLTERAARKCTVRALNETARWIRNQASQKIANATGAPRPFLKKRFYIHKSNLKEAPMSTRISVNVFDVKAKNLGALTQLKTGAKAGRFTFDKAFVATMNARHGASIYKRKTKARFPVREMDVSIRDQAMPIVEQTLKEAAPYYEKRLQHHMDFEQRRSL